MVDVREVTEAEVLAFKRDGWVLLRELIPPPVAHEMRLRAEALMGPDADGSHPGIGRGDGIWNAFHGIGREHDPLFWSVATHSTMGRNAARLLGRESSIRLMSEQLAVKVPACRDGSGATPGSDPTKWHQDWFGRGVDRTTLTTWIALCDIPPERGSMRFLNGSHRYGALGASTESAANVAGVPPSMHRIPERPPLPEMWPDLADCPLSEPLHLHPGDATVHSAFVVHSAPANATDQARWVYLMGLFPGDAIYNGMPNNIIGRTSVKPGHVIDDPAFPEIYLPKDPAAPSA